MSFVWLNGEMVTEEQANVPFMTGALHYGTAVFEGLRCYKTDRGPSIFRLQDHAARLLASARVLGIREDLPSLNLVMEAIREVVNRNDFMDCYIRPLIYVQGGFNLVLDKITIGFGVAAWEWNRYLGEEALELGIRANVSSFTRHHPNATMVHAKIAGNYANSALARTESTRLGFDEAIMLDPQGYVAECTGENIFLVQGGKIYTPPPKAILEGITRDTTIVLAREAGLVVTEQMIARDQLYTADEVFVTGTAAEVIGLREIDFRTIGSWGTTGPITKHLQWLYHEATHGSLGSTHGWQSLNAVEAERSSSRLKI